MWDTGYRLSVVEGLSASNALHTVVLTAQIHSFLFFFLVYETLNKKTKQAPGENHNLKITTSPLNYILDHGSFFTLQGFFLRRYSCLVSKSVVLLKKDNKNSF